jgi:hypothetical protein
MNITRDVITDLLPAYFSGEASADTRSVVEQFFHQDPAFEQEARSDTKGLQVLSQTGIVTPDSRLESKTLKRAKRLLRVQAILLALASTFGLNAVSLSFSFEVGNGATRIHWLALPGQRTIVLLVFAVSVLLWILYAMVRRRVRMRVMG